eukprot:gene12189-16257_t
MEAELYGINELAKSLLRTKNILSQLNLFDHSKPIIIYTDSQSSIAYACTMAYTPKNRHFDPKLNFIRKLIQDKVFILESVSTKFNPANLGTKAHHRELLVLLRDHLQN